MCVRIVPVLSLCLVYSTVMVVGMTESCENENTNYTRKHSISVSVLTSIQRETSFLILWTRTVTKYFYKFVKKFRDETVCCPGYLFDSNNTCIAGCEDGKYGDNCTQNCTCPKNAFPNCDKLTGKCTCIDGWTGTNCTDACDQGFYGPNCRGQCSCENNSTCNGTSGQCSCTSPGWHGESCEIACNETSFGLLCKEKCTCHVNQSCDGSTGNCTCKPGRIGTDCQDECSPGSYGKDCLFNCTCNETNTAFCNVTSGQCACKPGFSGPDCQYVCPFGTYGDGCRYNCSTNCSYTNYCDPLTGVCICIGKMGVNCSEECSAGSYGKECLFNCTCNETNTDFCNVTSGQCACKPGFSGPDCQYACPFGTYGDGCRYDCSANCSYTDYCDPLTGKRACQSVSEQCVEGTFGMNCQESCPCGRSEVCDPIFGNCSCKPGHNRAECVHVHNIANDLKQNTTSLLDGYEFPVLVSGGIAIVIVLVIIASLCIVKRQRMRRNQDVKESPSKIDLNMDNFENPSYIPLEQVAMSSGIGNEANRVDADRIVNAVPYEDSKISVATQQYPDVIEYVDTTVSPDAHGSNTYNTFRDLHQLQTNGEPNDNNNDAYNVLHELGKRNQVNPENYSAFQHIRNDNTGDVHDDTYSVVNEPRQRTMDELETYSHTNTSIPSEKQVDMSVGFKDRKEAYENHQFGNAGAEEALSDVKTNDNNMGNGADQTQCYETIALEEIYQNCVPSD